MTRCAPVLMFVLSMFITGCGGASKPAVDQAGAKPPETKTPKDQIVLSAEEQATSYFPAQNWVCRLEQIHPKNKPAGRCPAGQSWNEVTRGSVKCLGAWPARDRC